MSKEHKRPLYAFVILVLACAVVMAHGLRTEALQGWLRVPAATVVAGVELTRVIEPDPPMREVAPAPVAKAPVAEPDTGAVEPARPARGDAGRGRRSASSSATVASVGAAVAPVSAPAKSPSRSSDASGAKGPGRPGRGRHGGRTTLPVATPAGTSQSGHVDDGYQPDRGWSRGWGTRAAQAMDSGWGRDRDRDQDWDRDRADGEGSRSWSGERSRTSWGTPDRSGWSWSHERDWR